ncbi:MAG: DUF4892 domain-containing protein [Gammaproteobacteria bacterium]|nr:DUF4892 domain-containing protein [Gammaproteobacteria bacterium]
MVKRFFLLLLVNGTAWGQDVSGSRDPLGLSRYPFAWIEKYSLDEQELPREFIVSPVEKIRRDLRIERKVRVTATFERTTYRIPDGASRADVVDHYVRLLGSEELFSCEGRDCGRSNQWANDVFKVAFLYGPDENQHYLAANHDGHLVSVYIIERGNKRIYAHLEVMKPDREISIGLNEKLTERLAGDGFAVIEGVTPRVDGTLPVEGERVLADLAKQLNIFYGQRVFVVCHLYGPKSAEQLLDAATDCSERASQMLTSENGPELVNFSAGPLLPRAAGAIPRLELVIPHRLNRN